MSTFEVAIMVLLIFAVIVVGYLYYGAYQKKNELIQKPSTKGMNGIGGDTINLTCPAGQVISFDKINTTSTRGSLVCLGDSTCDAFYQPDGQEKSFFNPSNTIDVFSASSPFKDIKNCAGQQTCSWTIPDKTDSRLPKQSSTPGACLKDCSGPSATLGFIGTYDCVAP
jgi:hypothetical protein